mmetsp:Transcript_26095/g.65593  ORF Transcript_26095/g.65593 Transcript_26095/m.65593 type:complete len:128 (-) Transcript_26095:196-579(-)
MRRVSRASVQLDMIGEVRNMYSCSACWCRGSLPFTQVYTTSTGSAQTCVRQRLSCMVRSLRSHTELSVSSLHHGEMYVGVVEALRSEDAKDDDVDEKVDEDRLDLVCDIDGDGAADEEKNVRRVALK